jgi:methionine-rich copper-binding protein CopC
VRNCQFRSLKLAAIAGAALLLAGFALTHLHLKASVPAADSTVKNAPSQILLIFSAHPEAALSRVQLMGPDSSAVTTGKPAAGSDSLSLTIPISSKLADGRYTVRWRAAGRDGHPAAGDFAFTVGGSAGGNTAASMRGVGSMGEALCAVRCAPCA